MWSEVMDDSLRGQDCKKIHKSCWWKSPISRISRINGEEGLSDAQVMGEASSKAETVQQGRMAEEFSDSPVPSYAVEIFSVNDLTWQSEELNLGDEIPVVHKEGQIWHLERDSDSPLWSFHTKSRNGKKKLYVTYDDNDPLNSKVTLQYASDRNSKERYFSLLRLPGIRFVLASPSNHRRILCFSENMLIMTDANEPLENGEWKITAESGNEQYCAESEEFPVGTVKATIGEIKDDKKPQRKWVSDHAALLDRVPVKTSSQQNWWIEGGANSTTFKPYGREFFVSLTDDEVLFNNKGSDSLIEFAIERPVRQTGALIKSTSSNNYLNIDRYTLGVEQNGEMAATWMLPAAHLEFSKGEEMSDIFPMLPILPASSDAPIKK